MTDQTLSPQVLDLVAAHTLYDRSSLIPESHLEGELGIDSIILESILREVGERFGVRLEPRSRPVTLQDLIALVESGVSAEAREGTGGILDAVLAATMRHTQYRREQLDLDAELEGELGIDSVVLTAIVADVARELGVTQELPGRLTATTLRSLTAEILTYAPSLPAHQPSSTARRTSTATSQAIGTEEANALPPQPNTPARQADTLPPQPNTPALQADTVTLRPTTPAWQADTHIAQPNTPAWQADTFTPQPNGPERQTTGVTRQANDVTRQPIGTAGQANGTGRQLEQGLAIGEVDRAARPAASVGPWDGRSMKDFMDRRDPDLFAKMREFSGYLRQREAEHLYWYGMPLQSRCTSHRSDGRPGSETPRPPRRPGEC